MVFMVTQRYQFESNSQLTNQQYNMRLRCLWSHKDTNLKAIHNYGEKIATFEEGVYGHTKIPIWKQFTTGKMKLMNPNMVFMVTQRYQFESNSQHRSRSLSSSSGVYGHTKIPIWKQFTTAMSWHEGRGAVFMVTQRYQFESNSQPNLTYAA